MWDFIPPPLHCTLPPPLSPLSNRQYSESAPPAAGARERESAEHQQNSRGRKENGTHRDGARSRVDDDDTGQEAAAAESVEVDFGGEFGGWN